MMTIPGYFRQLKAWEFSAIDCLNADQPYSSGQSFEVKLLGANGI